MNNEKHSLGENPSQNPAVVACVVFRTQNPEQVIQALTEALAGIGESALPEVPPKSNGQIEGPETWLKHPDAAEYLGISSSTLYRYACQHRIEYRKLCGRLEYRRSTLDGFKDLQIRPATRWHSSARIIPAALGSGK